MNGKKRNLLVQIIDDRRGEDSRAQMAEKANKHAEAAGLRPNVDFTTFTKDNLDDFAQLQKLQDACVRLAILEDMFGLRGTTNKIPLKWYRNEEPND